MRRLIFFLTTGIIILTVIVLFFVFMSITSPRQTQSPDLSVPTPIPLNLQQNPNPRKPIIRYSEQKTKELIDKAKIRQPISSQGESAKQNLISNLGNTSGRVFINSNVAIDYIASPDLFQAEILSSNINTAKQDAVNFMASQGFSQADICSLPLSFYLSSNVSSELKNSNIIFNPLPEGC